jgi:Major Facilitator Superfamily
LGAVESGLWRDPDFVKLWLGQTVSKFGSGITGSALSLTAVLVLGASATQMGLLSAAAILPLVALGLFAGVWVDRLRRRPVLIWADLGRALILLTVPAAALAGQLSLTQLFFVAAGTGALTVFFDVAYQAYVPGLVGRRRVLEANSKLASSEALAEVATPGLAGLLVALISAPMAVLLDAVSFVFSALCIALVRRPEGTPRPGPDGGGDKEVQGVRRDVRREIGEGLRLVAGNPYLRAIAGYAAGQSFFGNFIGALYTLFVLQELGLGPVLLGVAIGIGGASNLLGTVLVGPVTRRFGTGRTMVGAVLLASLTGFLTPLAGVAADSPFAGGPNGANGANGAGGAALVGFAFLAAAQAFDFIHPLFEVNALTVRQTVTPPAMLGRVNASMRVLEGGAAPLGAVVGGVLGDLIGVRPTLFLAFGAMFLNTLWLARSPLKTLDVSPPGG